MKAKNCLESNLEASGFSIKPKRKGFNFVRENLDNRRDYRGKFVEVVGVDHSSYCGIYMGTTEEGEIVLCPIVAREVLQPGKDQKIRLYLNENPGFINGYLSFLPVREEYIRDRIEFSQQESAQPPRIIIP
ncbi:MAG: hypothetical protein QXS38_00465 [Candidatus Pacearchaeota archaeon]